MANDCACCQPPWKFTGGVVPAWITHRKLNLSLSNVWYADHFDGDANPAGGPESLIGRVIDLSTNSSGDVYTVGNAVVSDALHTISGKKYWKKWLGNTGGFVSQHDDEFYYYISYLIDTDSNDNVYIAGSWNSSNTLNLRKYNSSHEAVWTKNMYYTSDPEMIVDADDYIYYKGRNSVLYRLDPDGDVVWYQSPVSSTYHWSNISVYGTNVMFHYHFGGNSNRIWQLDSEGDHFDSIALDPLVYGTTTLVVPIFNGTHYYVSALRHIRKYNKGIYSGGTGDNLWTTKDQEEEERCHVNRKGTVLTSGGRLFSVGTDSIFETDTSDGSLVNKSVPGTGDWTGHEIHHDESSGLLYNWGRRIRDDGYPYI